MENLAYRASLERRAQMERPVAKVQEERMEDKEDVEDPVDVVVVARLAVLVKTEIWDQLDHVVKHSLPNLLFPDLKDQMVKMARMV